MLFAPFASARMAVFCFCFYQDEGFMRRYYLGIAVVMCFGCFALAGTFAEKKKIKEVMKAGFAGDASLCKKVVSGEGTDDDKKKFMDLLIDLVENDAPKGDEIEWKTQSGKALIAAAKVVAGREGATAELKDAVNCKSCHDKFKGK
jgi:hypothetical protein